MRHSRKSTQRLKIGQVLGTNALKRSTGLTPTLKPVQFVNVQLLGNCVWKELSDCSSSCAFHF